MKSKENRSARAESATEIKDSVKVAEKKAKKKNREGKDIPKEAKKELESANITKAAKDEVTERHTKYIYPADVKSTKEKKDFRRKARAKIQAFEKEITRLGKKPEDEKALKAKKKEFADWRAEFITPIEQA